MGSDAKDISLDVQAGIVDLVTAANSRGYDGEKVVEQAKKDHAERAARIAKAQTDAAASARGVNDLSTTQDGSKIEKQAAQDQTLNSNPQGTGQRGGAK